MNRVHRLDIRAKGQNDFVTEIDMAAERDIIPLTRKTYAGAVELGFLGGAAGDLGSRAGWLLLAWRFYTNGVGVILGVILAARIYGWPALRRLPRRWSDAH